MEGKVKKTLFGKELRSKDVAARRRASTQRGKRAVGGCQRFVDLGIAVRRRYEPGFIGRRRQIDAGVEHRVKEMIEARLVARHDLVVRLRYSGGEVDAE